MRPIPNWWSLEGKETRTRSSRSRRTASPSISTRTQSLAAMMQSAIYDLTTAMPHEPDGARFSAAEFAIYRGGYEKALEISPRATRAAAQRFELIERTRRIDERKAHPREHARNVKETRPSETPALRAVESTPAPQSAS